MKEEKDKYSADDIRKYLDGQLSGTEMQALEKAALEDPFLADAIEGVEESRKHAVSFESGVEELQNRLSKRIRENKQKPGIIFLNWKIAASLIFILGLTIFMYNYLVRKTPPELAVTTKKDSSKEKSASSPASQSADSINNSSTKKLPGNSGSETAADNLNEVADEKKIKRSRKTPVPIANKNIAFRKKETEAPGMGYNNAVPDTNAKAANTVASTEHEDQPASIPKLASDQLDKKESGLSPERKKTRESVASARSIPVTVIGQDSLNHFINTNKKINSSDSLLKGEEIISFLVLPDGRLSSFKIEKSISPAHDAEVLRLINLGPALKNISGKGQICRVTIFFK